MHLHECVAQWKSMWCLDQPLGHRTMGSLWSGAWQVPTLRQLSHQGLCLVLTEKMWQLQMSWRLDSKASKYHWSQRGEVLPESLYLRASLQELPCTAASTAKQPLQCLPRWMGIGWTHLQDGACGAQWMESSW